MICKLLRLSLMWGSVIGSVFLQSAQAGDRRVEIEKAMKGLDVKKPAEGRKLLVFSLTRGFKHASIPTGQLMMQLMAEKTGAFEVVDSNDLANFEPDQIKKFDAICFLNTTMEVFSPAKGALAQMSEDEKKNSAETEARLKKAS